MFEYLSGVGAELHAELVKMYWVLLVPFVLFLFVMEILKDENPNIKEIFRRILISILLLYTFSWAVDAIATIGDAVTAKINGLEKLSEVLAKLGPNYSGQDSWFSMRDTALYIFSLAAYIIAYVGFFVAMALTHFVWTILYICAPLMILAYVSPITSHVTTSLYKGMIQVVLWKILWSILGILLLNLAIQPAASGMEDYLMSIVVNLCIGISMLFIPIATKSLLGDGMNGLASTLAMAPALATAGVVKLTASKWGSKLMQGAKNAGSFTAKPVTNPIAGRYQMMKEKIKPRFKSAKRRYESFGLPKEMKNKNQRRT
ncbi:MAG: hypothetical protein ACOYOK_01725 [Pseudobdellovibrionaceae bacterium]